MKLIAFIFLLFLIALGPLCTIWAINTLAPMAAIPYTLETWCAVVILWGLGFGIHKQTS
jgi:hypothetical protein